MALRGVIFDMGGTLLDYHPPAPSAGEGWRAMEDLGADALRAFLLERGYPAPPAEEARQSAFAAMERQWRMIAEGKPVNPQLGPILREVLLSWGLPESAANDGLIDSAVAAYVAPAQALVRPLPGAAETLAALRAQGLRLGLFSNTVWPGAFHLEDLARWGLAGYLDCAFFSADAGAWKPARQVFQMTLEALGLQPQEAAFVGDHPYFDVYGAQQAGLRGVLLKSAEWEAPPSGGLPITPDATVTRLADLLPLVEAWRTS